MKSKSWTKLSELYLYGITRCLSKLDGWFWRILSISLRLSNTKTTMWSLWFQILNPFVDRHSCLKVRAVASKFKKRGVKNFAAKRNSPDHCSLERVKPSISLSDREKLFHWLAKSSIVRDRQKKTKKRPKKVYPQTPNKTHSHNNNDFFYCY